MGSKPSVSAPTTYAPPAPPTASNAAAVQASADARQKALEKQGLTSTILGQQASSNALGTGMFTQPQGQKQNTLLGGG
jgi:hypothetical protein